MIIATRFRLPGPPPVPPGFQQKNPACIKKENTHTDNKKSVVSVLWSSAPMHKRIRIKPFLIEIVKLISFDRRFWRFTLYKPDTCFFFLSPLSFVLRHFCVLLLNTWCWAALWLFTRTPQDIRLSGFIRLFVTSIWIQTDQNRKKDSAMSPEWVRLFCSCSFVLFQEGFSYLRPKKKVEMPRGKMSIDVEWRRSSPE